MVSVKLLNASDVHPEDLASHAAKVCYNGQLPRLGDRMNVRKQTFEKGHHTVYQHFYLTFAIDGIAVGDVTFGLHLASPFYNSDQRSGRFCAKMFLEPDYDAIRGYIEQFWPELDASQTLKTMNYIVKGTGLYHDNISAAEALAKQLIAKERPRANADYIDRNGPKIAQEQTRMFIPVIYPTGLDFTINSSALAAYHAATWSPQMEHVIGLMAKAFTAKYPETAYLFDQPRQNYAWSPRLEKLLPAGVLVRYQPKLRLGRLDPSDGLVLPRSEEMHPIDLLHFRPEYMENSVNGLKTEVELSTATMGQDQRHRTIDRGLPSFTGNFYLPPLLRFLNLQAAARELMAEWIKLHGILPRSLATILAPYGAIVRYRKYGNYNAVPHEQAKRLCWCAQEEIYHSSRLLRAQASYRAGKNSRLMKFFEPPCLATGICAEGDRYCGRDLKNRDPKTYFPLRKI